MTLAILLSFMTVSVHAQMEVKAEYDKKIKYLKTYKTYKFMGNASFPVDDTKYTPFQQRTVLNTIHEELSWLGMKETETPDLHIYVYAIVENKTETQTEMPTHKNEYGTVVQLKTTIVNYDEGTLVLDFVDAKTKKLVWRGSANDVVSNNQKEVLKSLKRAIRKMLAKYPPIKI